ncbi:hypothetical protein TNCV_3068861 [Trichonephila clavipes]|nr:hypothetical protein TNCV_3068861 [Trichonephila clavipes]
MSEGRFDLSTFRSERTNEASTLTITPKRSSSRDTALRSNGLFASMFDGLVAFAMDRWRHDCGARRVRIISRPGSPMSEGRFDLSTFRSERTNEASTLTITPKRSSSRDRRDNRHPKFHPWTEAPAGDGSADENSPRGVHQNEMDSG